VQPAIYTTRCLRIPAETRRSRRGTQSHRPALESTAARASLRRAPAPDARRGQKTRALSRHQRIRVSAMPGRTHLCGGGHGVRARTPLRPVLEHMVDLPAPVLHPPQAAHTKVSGNRTPPIRRSPKVPARARGLVSQPSIAVGNVAARDRLPSAVSGSFREAQSIPRHGAQFGVSICPTCPSWAARARSAQ